MEAFNMMNTLNKIHSSLGAIAKVLKGTGMLTSSIEEEGKKLLKREVPSSWTAMWEGPENPQSWLIQFMNKANAIVQWIERADGGKSIDAKLNLNELFHPETFLNALRQKSARKLQVPIDDMKLIASFEKGKINSPIKVVLEGLFIQGCGFDGVRMIDINEKQQVAELLGLPQMELAWVNKQSANPYGDSQTVNTPVYFNITRENLLCKLDIPNSGKADLRIISGTALFLGSDE
jgi:dynein heavy chain 2, cytosolic